MTNPYDPQSGYTPPPTGATDAYGQPGGAYQPGAYQPGAYQPGAYPAADPYQAQAQLGGYSAAPEAGTGWGIAACVVGAISSLSCCLGVVALALGVVALVKGSSVKSAWALGDFAGAQRNAEDAKRYGMIGTIVGGIFIVLSIIMWVAYFIFAVSASST